MDRRAFLRASGSSGLALSVPATTTAARSSIESPSREGYEPLGRIPITGAAEGVAGDDGETAYVAATTGFVTVDISDPAEPTLLAEERDIELEGGSLSEILDVTVDGDRLVAAGPANPGFGGMGFRCYDVSDPTDPVSTGALETGYHIHNCYLEGDLLFVAANTRAENRLVIFDVGGDEIERVGYWSLLEREPGWREVYWLARYLHDVFVRDDLAYLPYWNAGTYLVDVSDPTEPEYVSHVAETTLEEQRERRDPDAAVRGLPGNDHYAAVDETGELMAVSREAWATGSEAPDRPGGIDLYDVTDPEEPAHQGSIDAPRTDDESYRGGMWTTAHNFELRDGHLYSSWYRAGVKIHDVSDPTAPEQLAWWRDPEATGFWTARVVEPGDAFLATSTEAIPNASLEGALYTFPIEAGEQADPPSLRDPDSGTDGGGTDDGTNGSAETDGEGTGAASTGDGTDGMDGSPSGTTETDRGTNGTDGADSIPGFTGLSTLVGGGVALEWLRRRDGNVQD
ncbi:LVIVD repeat-containing protein [Natrinema longum]|uniref:LVIVD repeat-containing protein n=1 Tax=Natrinema longum TaxID=370324 RepID=A0A8A2U6U5_9EURY|nr:hypothetical protein [Natrinema longum]MBZ6494255.1 hypothetical protein [Natrinema longum]QSW84420.1 hypothetical protein J0X27_13295 [Natrinema longum]